MKLFPLSSALLVFSCAAQNSPQAYNDLASNLCQRAADTENPALLTQANAALEQSLKLSPGNYAAQKIKVSLLLEEHRWPDALVLAKSLNARVPDDLEVWCLLARAYLAVGNKDEAQKAAQWALDLRQGNRAAYYPAAQVREAFGDPEGAIEFLNEAFQRTPENDSAARAFLLTEIARLSLLTHNPERATDLVKQALQEYPAYPRALRLSLSTTRPSAQ